MKIKFIDKNKTLVEKVKKTIPHFECICDDIFNHDGVIVSASNPSFTFGWWLDALIAKKYPEECKQKQTKKGWNERIWNVIFTISVDDNIKSNKSLIWDALQSIMMFWDENETILLSWLGTAIGWLPEDDFIDVLKDFFPNIWYKGMNKNMKCRNYKFEIWKVYQEKTAKLCNTWFHYCQKLENVYNYYNKDCRIFKIEILWQVDFWTDKDCSTKIKIIKEIDSYWIKQYKSKTNSGDRNSGYWNSGYFNIDEPKTIRIFGKDIKKQYIKFPSYFYFNLTKWINISDMTDKEKQQNPFYWITDWYLKKYDYKEARKLSFNNATKEEVKKTIKLPKFDYKIFEKITGITKDMILSKIK